MEEQDIIHYFKKMHRDVPRDAWLLQAKHRLFLRMEGRRMLPAEKPSFSLFAFLGGFLQPKAMMAGVCLLLFAVSIAVAGAVGMSHILPSSPLYPFKLAVESAEGTLAFTEEQKADYGLAVAQERIQELALLSQETANPLNTEKHSALIANTLRRYTEALGTSARTVKLMQANGKESLARQKAEKLDEAARAYTVLLATFDSASSSLTVFKDAESVSREAQSTAEEILSSFGMADGAFPSLEDATPSSSDPLSSDTLHEASSTETPSLPGSTILQKLPAILPNVIE